MKYEEYKDSGVEWIGEVPSHWEVKPIKRTGSFENGLTYSPTDICEGNGVLVLRSSNIQNDKLSFEDNVYVTKCPSSLMVRPGDIIICSRNGSASLVGKCAMVEEDINASYGAFMMRYRPICDSNKVFSFYLLQTALKCYKGLYSTTTINQLTKGVIGQIYVSYPPLPEQQAIATYLDEKCEKINTAIEVQKKKIELLEELKQSIITDAVTKGLNPNATMKDSGVEWIGEVPSHWEIMPLKSCGQFKKGVTFTKADIVEEGIPVISYGQIHAKNNAGTHLHEDLIRYIPNSFVKGSTISKVSKGDFIFADTSEDYEGCGNCVYIDMDYSLYGGYHTIVYKTKTQENKFLAYLFKTDCWRYQIRSRVSGVKVFSITQSIISLCSVVLPPLSEQQAIAAHLDKECEKIATQISKANRRIELLEELKQSIITEAVTGKIKVC